MPAQHLHQKENTPDAVLYLQSRRRGTNTEIKDIEHNEWGHKEQVLYLPSIAADTLATVKVTLAVTFRGLVSAS